MAEQKQPIKSFKELQSSQQVKKVSSFSELQKPTGFENIAYRTVVGALRDAGQATIEFGDFLNQIKNPTYLSNILGLIEAKRRGMPEAEKALTDYVTQKKEPSITLPEVPEPEGIVPQFGRTLLQYGVPYAGTRKALSDAGIKITKKAGEKLFSKDQFIRTGKEIALGSAVEQYAFSPEEERLSNLLQEVAPNAVFEFLQSNPDDPETLQRLKMAIEGSALAVPFEFAARTLGKLRAQKTKEIDVKEAAKTDENIATDISAEQTLQEAQPYKPQAGVKTYDENLKQKENIIKAQQKDPINFKFDDVSGNATAKVGKNKFDFVRNPDGTYQLNIKSFRNKEEVEAAINIEKDIQMTKGVDIDNEIPYLRKKFTEEEIDRPVEKFNNLTDAKKYVVKRFVNKGGLPSDLSPVQPKVKLARSILKFHPEDYGLEDIASSMGYTRRELPPSYLSKDLRPGDAFERAGEKLSEAGFTGRLSDRTTGYSGLEKDEIDIILADNRPLPSDAKFNNYQNFQAQQNAADKLVNKLESAGYDPTTMTNAQVKSALKNIDNEENYIQQGLDQAEYFDSQADEFEIQKRSRDERVAREAREASGIVDEPEIRLSQGGNKPPIEGPEKAGNIRLDKYAEPEDFKKIVQDVVDNQVNLDAARRVVRFGSKGEELTALAQQLGMTPDDVMLRKVGQAFNAEQVHATRMLFDEAGARVATLAGKVADPSQASDALRVELKYAMTKFASLAEQLVGITAEAGRALRAYREYIGPAEEKNKFIADFLKTNTRDDIDEVAKAITQIDSDEGLATFVKEAYKPTTKDMIQELWINGLLSAPPTHMVNIMSNTLTTSLRPAEYFLAAAAGKFRKGDDKITFAEAGARLAGSVHGALEGLRGIGKYLLKGEPLSTFDDPLTKLELAKQKAIPGLFGDVVRIPGTALQLGDALFKTMGQQQEYFGRAVRQAKKEGKGIKRAYELLKDKSKLGTQVKLDAIDEGRYLTFTKPLEGLAKNWQSFVTRHPGWRFLTPFVRTPVNIVNYAFDRTLLSLLSRQTREDIFIKGGLARDKALGKIALGTSIMLGVSTLAQNGQITGRGPSEWKEKQQLMEEGWQPYSLKVGNKYYSYNRFEPVGILFGVAADLNEIIRNAPQKFQDENKDAIADIAAQLVGSVSENLINKTFLTGLAGAVEVVSDPDRYGDKFLQRFAGSFVPTAFYYGRKAEDNLVRDARTTADNLINRLPQVGGEFFFGKTSKDLPPKRNVFGETIEYKPTPNIYGYTFIPINISEIQQDPVFAELNRIGYIPSMPKRKMGTVELTPEQYESLLKIQEELGTKQQLEQVILSPNYIDSTEYQKQMILETLIKTYQENARVIFRARNPNVVLEDVENKRKEIQK